MIDIFFKDSPVTIEGRQVPACWSENIDEVITVLPEWSGFHCPPVIGIALDGESIFHFMGTEKQADSIEAAGVFLARDYYTFQVVHPDLASRCAEVEYTLAGEPGRCKYADLPVGAVIQSVRAPSKYLGIESPTVPDPPVEGLFPTQVLEVSQADIGIMEMKEVVKAPAIIWMKTHPGCDAYDLIAAIAAMYDEPHAGAGQALLAVYIRNAHRAGLIPSATWEAFRAFIESTPIEMLEAF